MQIPPLIKEPCPVPWDDMRGDSRRRFCDRCQLHLQNLSAMPRRQVAGVLQDSGSSRVCVIYTQRADGGMVTHGDLRRERIGRPFRRAFFWLLAALVPVAFGGCSAPRPTYQLAGRIASNCQGSHSEKTKRDHSL